MKTKTVGYIVIEQNGDFDALLVLVHQKNYPVDGLLEFCDIVNNAAHLFETRAQARAAIERTEHYRLAFAKEDSMPERRFCKIATVRAAS